MSDASDDDLDFLGMAARPLAPAAPASAPASASASAPTGARTEELPAEPLPYDPQLALRFFQNAGNQETIAAGTRIFAEGDQSGLLSKSRVYLLLEGEVSMTLAGRPLAMMLPGETFGELAVISDAPRSASATARKNSRLLSLDQKQFLASLKQVPEFALMLISMMAERLRRSVEKLIATGAAAAAPSARAQGLSRVDVADVAHIIGKTAPTPMKAGDALIAKGALGAMMFVLVQGQVAVAIDGRVVETLGPGAIFGETAMLGKVRRGASVTAQTDGAWLSLTKNDFLKLVATNPAIGVALLRTMSERIRVAAEQIRAQRPA